MFIRTLTADERRHLEAGLRAREAFVVRRCQILLASARGERVSGIARSLGCATQTVRNVLRDFQARGLECLKEGSRRPVTVQPVLATDHTETIQTILHTTPRLFGKARSTWTLALVAEVACEQGLSPRRLSVEAIRRALARMGIQWKRAKHWITSPDPQYTRKKSAWNG